MNATLENRSFRSIAVHAGCGNAVSRQNRYPVPGTLPLPDRFIAEIPKYARWKRFLLSLKFLQADHIRLTALKPCLKIRQPFVDVVYVERRNLHAQ